MTFELFKACVDKLNTDVILDFTGFYEPFLNPECSDMLIYGHDNGFSIRVSTTLMGLTAKNISQIESIPFIKFAVHLPENKNLTRIETNHEYMEVLASLIESDISNIAFHVHEGADGPEQAHSTIQKLLIEKGITAEDRWITTRAGNIEIGWKSSPVRKTGPLQICPRLFQNVLLPNGDLALCCMDWGLNHVIGNLLVEDYDSIFESDEFRRILEGYEDDTIDILCRQCEVAQTKAEADFKSLIKQMKSNPELLGDQPDQ